MKTSIRKRKYDDEALNNGNPQKSIIYKEPKPVERATDSGLANNQWWKTGKSSVNYAPKVQTDSAVKGAPLVGESPYKIPPSNYDIYPNTNYAADALKAEKEGRFNDAAYFWGMRDQKIDAGLGGNYAKYNPYQYNSKYADEISDLRDKLENAESFRYNPLEDEAYQNLANVYSKNASDASANALAQMAAANGGRLSSNAAIASDLAYQNKMAGLEAEIPGLRQLAYDMYQGDLARTRESMNDYIMQDYTDYARWNSDLERRIDNQKYQNDLERQAEQTAYDRAKDEEQTAYDRRISEEQTAYDRKTSENQTAYDRAIEEVRTFGTPVTKETAELLGVPQGTLIADSYKWQNEMKYSRDRDKISDERWEREFAEMVRQFGVEEALRRAGL